MENKRSKGVTIFGRIILFGNLYLLFGYFSQMLYLESTLRPFGTFFYCAAALSILLAFIFSIYILKLKEWARRYFVILNIIAIALYLMTPLITGGYQSTDKYVAQHQSQLTMEQKENYEKYKVLLAEKTKRVTPEEKLRIEEDAPITAIVLGIIFIFWLLLLNFFFTRPKVKEQFI